ncbi:MAG: hypothetical protein ACRDKY_03140 [Solirubrobacteraceae bacterium]
MPDSRRLTHAPGARRTLGALAVTAALVGVAAGAQGQAPARHYGGGTIADPPTSIYDAGNVVISLRATANGKVQILAYMGAKCPTAFVRVNATRAADGSFAVAGTTKRADGGQRISTKYEISGTVSAPTAAGTASATTTLKRAGSAARTCKSGSVRWEARPATGDIGTPGAAVASARLYGTTSQRVGSRRHGIVMRVSADGTRVRRVLYTHNLRCAHATLRERDAVDRNQKIRADGTFSSVERRTQTGAGGARVRTVERFSGKIGSQGAGGTLSITARYVNASGRTYARCKTATVTWKAAP